MSMNLVNLNVNPCKMCMPMGSVSAFCGIKGCMTLLHGSQGCSTYIRRHMATHYNEPIDIASSSLTEEGTVFGGEKNLIKGLENLISLYHPEVIGVATTCLAETIGEDLPRMIRDFHVNHPGHKVKIIPVSASGYSGTQYEGFFTALKAILKFSEMHKEKHNKINIITGMLSPADTRYLKRLLADLEIDFILLPDLSENLDDIYQENYERLPVGGTSLEEISQMAGSRLSIELSSLISDEYSPAKYLYDLYGVPYLRCNMPIGLRDTDAFLNILKGSLEELPDSIKKERGRYLDAMVDSHKYNAEGKAAIFGEPDFVYSMARLCLENGIIPVVTATGSKCESLDRLLREQIHQVSNRFFIEDFIISDFCDFDHIEKYAEKYGANLMIGNSDGRRIEEKVGIPLIRCAFPVHDHVGGQRVRMLGYEGSVTLLDRITNTLLHEKEQNFRSDLFDKYYAGKETAIETVKALSTSSLTEIIGDQENLIAEKTKTHPCFSGCAGNYARIHLPVAKKCNIQCNYCLRKFDCPNESRPGVTTQILTPEDALEKYFQVKAELPNLKVVGIAGPGDALAEFENTKKTLGLIRQEDPEVTFCLSTNGLMLPLYINDLVALGVSHVTVTINAVDPKIGSKIYQKVDYMGVTYTGESAAAILLGNQLTGLKMLQKHGIICKVNIVMLKGINDSHIPAVVEKVKELGCTISNIMQMIPVKGSAFEHMPMTSHREVMEMRQKCGLLLDQMYHCRQCRADAVGTLENDEFLKFEKYSNPQFGKIPEIPDKNISGNIFAPVKQKTDQALLFAVASKGGILVDQHFGHVSDFYIYEYRMGVVKFLERRSVTKYCNGPDVCDGNADGSGGGNKEGKMERIFDVIADCSCVIAMRAGEAPKRTLTEKGIGFMMYYGRIEDAAKEAAAALSKENRKEAIS